MGALHDGHLALVKCSRAENDVTIASIFVNPTQFNDPTDLINYPRTLQADYANLEENGCDIVFTPTVEEIYPSGTAKIHVDYGLLTNTLEGALREGHFDGVVQVVRRLLDIATCQKAYFGEKDFQQLAVIRHMVKLESIPTEIVSVSTIRETNGLAMSSRNRHLSDSSILAAQSISKALYRCSELSSSSNLLELKREAIQSMKDTGVKPEYFEIINPETFEVLLSLENQKKARAVTAAFVGEIRLIDNMAVGVTEANRISEPQPY